MLKIVLFMASLILWTSCKSTDRYTILYGENSDDRERVLCEELAHDLGQATHSKVSVTRENGNIPSRQQLILVGTPSTSKLVSEIDKEGLCTAGREKPSEKGGLITPVRFRKQKMLLIAADDFPGLQTAVYDFSENDLGTDPLSYWTGYQPEEREDFSLYDVSARFVNPPAIPIVCYFENDVDELANMQKPYLEYDMETWRGMINSLRRLHYNAIHIFDMFGRAEFYTREGYKKIRPDYKANLPLIDSLIDYAHLKGMKVQVDLSLGYQMKSITDEQAACWSEYKKEWIGTWVYYLTQTPLKKADIYSLRPRNPVWDHPYASSCGENKAEVFNEVFASADSILDIYRPDALRICVCYDDGMEIFNDGFTPPEDFIVAWSDDGYCDFKYLPDSNRGYTFGTYMHAGFWRNHTVHDPCPGKIDSVMTLMIKDYDATGYLQVNGQTFRPFLLNLDAFGRLAYDPDNFEGDRFYHTWCLHYFGEAASGFAVESMKALHETQTGRSGYVQFLGEIRKFTGFLQDTLVSGPALSRAVQFENLPVNEAYKRVEKSRKALSLAEQGLLTAKDQNHFYYDYVYLPALMLNQLLEFECTLGNLAVLKAGISPSAGQIQAKTDSLLDLAEKQLDEIHETALKGDKYEKWSGWYDPAKRRPNNGFPEPGMITEIRANLEKGRKGNEMPHED